MKRKKLLNDHLLGKLCQVLAVYGDKSMKKSKLLYAYGIMHKDIYSNLLYLESLGLVNLKITLTPMTFTAAQLTERQLVQKSQAAMVGPTSGYGIQKLRDEAAKMKKISDYLRKKYGTEKTLTKEDLQLLAKNHKDLHDTLMLHVDFSTKQATQLVEFIKGYLQDYKQKELDGQETLYLPLVYATTSWIQIDSTETKNMYGKKRIYIKSNGEYFCHSLLFLEDRGLITIHEFRDPTNIVKLNQIDGAVLDNIYEEKPKNQQGDSPKAEAYWQADFLWNGDTFSFSEYGKIKFDSKARKELFKALVDGQGSWVNIKALEKASNHDAAYVRATIKQIEDRIPAELKSALSIPSTQDDDLPNKPDQGAYRLRFTPPTRP